MPSLIISNKKSTSIYIIGSIVLMGILMQIWVFHFLGLEWKTIIIDSIISNLILSILCFAILNNLKYYKPSKKRYFYLFVLIASITVLWLLSIKWILFYLFSENANYLIFIQKSLPIRFCFSFLLIGFSTTICWILQEIKDQKENDQRKIDTEKLAKEAELFKLRQQLQPHFLFNSLNSISALAGSKPEEARNMIQQLSDFLRGTLKSDDQQLLSLSEELQYLQLYLDIEKVRFGHRLSTEIKSDDKALLLKLPPLLLQPIVENAIKFGLYDTTEKVIIEIESYVENNQLLVKVQNPFDPETAQPKGTGFGLNSIRRRLYLLYARNDLLEIKTENNTFITLVKIPQIHD